MPANLGTNELERDSGPLDPLLIAKGIDERDGDLWKLIAFAGPSRTNVTVWVVGTPLRGIVLCRDSADGERECIRFDQNGREIVRIVGSAPSLPAVCHGQPPATSTYGDHRIDEAAEAVELVLGGRN